MPFPTLTVFAGVTLIVEWHVPSMNLNVKNNWRTVTSCQEGGREKTALMKHRFDIIITLFLSINANLFCQYFDKLP